MNSVTFHLGGTAAVLLMVMLVGPYGTAIAAEPELTTAPDALANAIITFAYPP